MNLVQKVFLFGFILSTVFSAYADGSKDLYPLGVRGGRAFLESVTYSNGHLTHNYYNNATHFAYVKKGELLAVASSAQGVGRGTIRVISPSGIVFSSGSNAEGKIVGSASLTNRQAELAGPRLGYKPFEIAVEEEGLWSVEFYTPDSLVNNNNIPNILADEDWIQRNDHNLIAAWDVSVRNVSDTEWLSGRVYVNVLNLHMNGGNMADINRSFFGVNFVLTKDGYYYKVDGNGSIGLKFTYFVNNSGVLDDNLSPTYKSSVNGYNARLHNPNHADVENEFVTHKIFYTLPNEDLPKESTSIMGTTWLLNTIQIANVSNVRIESSEGTINHVNTKGSKISFETNYTGRYKVVVKSKESGYKFKPFETIVQAQIGNNELIWPGVDGDGRLLPIGNYDIQVSIASVEGEVHFPYFDTEINPNGLKLERYDRSTNTFEPAVLYWDDSEIPKGNIIAEHSDPIVNLTGIPSNINGHRWGTYSITTGGAFNNNQFTGANSFGNNMAMDTWSYAVQVEENAEKNITVEIADLEVVSVVADKDSIDLNETVQYTIKVKNNGPSDVIGGKFEYALPLGFNIDQFGLVNSDCGSIGSVFKSNNTLQVSLDIKNGCEMVFVVKTHANNVPDETYGFVQGEAGVVRPRGFTDPDATSNDQSILEPKSAREECSPQGCNNIKINADVFLLEPFEERGQLALLKSVQHIDKNGSGFQEAGETLVYKFTLRNVGQVDVDSLVITDPLLNPSRIKLNNIVLKKGQEFIITETYTITNQDVINKKVANRASVLGKNPRNFDVKDVSGTSFSTNDSTYIDIDKAPILRLKKSVLNKGTGENQQFTIGDKVVYRFDIFHEGDIAVENISLIDNLLFNSEQALKVNQLKNQTVSFEFPYIVTEEDIQNGTIENSAIVNAVDIKYNNTLSDTSGNSFETNDITVTSLASPAIAKQDFIEVFQGQIVSLKILDNDQKGSSNWDKGRIEIIENPTMGILDIQGLEIKYIQNNNLASGSDFFIYRIHDNSRLASNIVRVDINILKTIPVAVDDFFIQNYNTKSRISPTKNDYVEYSELDIESITVVNQPANGTLIYQGNGIFVYESNKTFSGVDEFTYRIRDKNGNWSKEATVKIEIQGLLIPNVITPNGDGLNDTFEILGLYKFDGIELQVFDRFKNKIYENSNYQNNWEVSSSVRDGTYFYMLKFNKQGEKPLIKRGSLLLTREFLN